MGSFKQLFVGCFAIPGERVQQNRHSSDHWTVQNCGFAQAFANSLANGPIFNYAQNRPGGELAKPDSRTRVWGAENRSLPWPHRLLVLEGLGIGKDTHLRGEL